MLSYTNPKSESTSKRTKKEPTHLGPPDNTVAFLRDGTTVPMRGHSSVAEQWINGHDAMGKKYGDKKLAEFKTLHSHWTRSIAYAVWNMDDYVNHVWRTQPRS